MDRKIKLIWDFRGPSAHHTAEHHKKHLKEFVATESVACQITGTDRINEVHSIAFMVVDESDMLPIRDVLKPHRAQLYIP